MTMTSIRLSLHLSGNANDARLTAPKGTHDLERAAVPSIDTSSGPNMSPNTLVVHTSLLFDPKQKSFLENMTIEVDPETGSIVRLFKREGIDIPSPDSTKAIDLRGKFVVPGFVDSHTHIFLHSYK
jgi:adenine deaminase